MNKLPFGEASRSSLYTDYKYHSSKRDIPFSLSREEFYYLTVQNCSYCGRPPSQVKNAYKCNGGYKYTGIDRVDSNLGYTSENVVSSCWVCNDMKGSLSREEFLRNVSEIHNFQSSLLRNT